MAEAGRVDRWAAGNRYEPFIGRWSRVVARAFVAGLERPPGLAWVDVGCGTGALTGAVLEQMAPRSVVGVDPSAGYLEYARAHVPDDRAQFVVAGAQALPLEAASVDVAVAGLVLNFVPVPLEAVTEMARVVRPGGRVAAYVWDYAGGMQLLRAFWDAVTALDPAAGTLDEGRRFPLCQPQPLAELFRAAGLVDVTVGPIDVPTPFRTFDEYWTPFLGGEGPAPGYTMTLDDARRDALRERLRAALPVQPDGSIHLTARAWAVRGRRPEA
ncbi:methyltransferase domain-containing protein [Deinococcus sp. KSM4-11]|uniref:class I SAM-dependent methyltransferase n=1 Tax=Deinococcus sp. KSM4-11 TaxID=2568654 RepID=UPI0010A2D5B0|nr:class I SAM-dependent methyltransferase [Deinococcus sp. KSM4-11]THF86533.1 methyltransferase domain-containing protein [Deinococcus sp. KSM4-11]